jgi:hypothetical protein
MSIIDDEYTQPEPDNSDSSFSHELEHHWMITGKWAFFLSITGFILTGIVILSMAFVGALMGTMFTATGDGAFQNPIFTMFSAVFQFGLIASLIMGGIMALLFYYMYNFGSKIQTAVRYNNQQLFEQAWANLRNYMRMAAILTAILVIFVLLFMVLASGIPAATEAIPNQQ